MLTANIQDREMMGIYQDSENPAQKFNNIQNCVVNNQILMITGKSGSGKSCLTEHLMRKYKREGYTVIVITEKMDYEFESAFAMFPVESKAHLEILDAMKVKPYPKEKTKELVKLYHPFCFKIPPVKLPPINFFTFSLKKLTEPSLISILYGGIEAGADAMTIRTSLNVIKNLKETEGIWDFLLESQKAISSKKDRNDVELDYNPNEKLIPISISGDQKTVDKIHDGFLPFREDYFVQPDKFKLNINMVKILNDNKHYHIFSTKWIKTPRSKFFVYITLMEQIKQAIASDQLKKPLCLIYEEIKGLLPANSEISYEKQLATVIMKINLAVRMVGTVIATSQEFFKTNRDFRGSCNEHFLFSLCEEDLRKFAHAGNLKQMQIDLIGTLRMGQFVKLSDLRQFKIDKYLSNLPPYAHAEQGERFIEKFTAIYPELLKDYTDLMLEMQNHRDNAESKVADYVTGLKEKAKKEKAQKEERQNKVPNKNAEVINQMKAEDLDELKKYCYQSRKPDLLGNVKSFRQIGNEAKIKLHHSTAKKYALDWAIKANDADYMKNVENI